MLSTRLHRWAIAALTVSALALPSHVLAQTPDHPTDSAAQFPSKTDLKGMTTAKARSPDFVEVVRKRIETV